MLMRDSRMAYRELADALGLSVAAVHGRVEQLIDKGIIRQFTVNLSMACQGAVPVIVFGRSQLQSADSASIPLSKDDRTYAYLVGAGNMVYVCGFLRSGSELDGYARHAISTAAVAEPVVALETMGPPGDLRVIKGGPCQALSPLDLRILDALRTDARKPLTEVAEKLGITAKTVKRHWDRLEAEGLIEKSIQWSPDSSGDIIVFLHLDIQDGKDRHEMGGDIMARYGPNVVFFRTFINLPSFLQLVLWGRSLREVKEAMERLEREEGVLRASSYIVYKGYWFPTWRDEPVGAEEPLTEEN
jgi:DNA-binding Lrp family transcriptional regulator